MRRINVFIMSRGPNVIQTVQVRISTTPAIEGHLERLVRTGLYGKNTAEAAERLIAEAVQRLLREGLLLPTPASKSGADPKSRQSRNDK